MSDTNDNSFVTRTPFDDPLTGKTAGSTGHSAGLGDLKAKLSEDVSDVTDAIKDGANSGMQKVNAAVSDQANFAAEQIAGIALALKKVGAELENEDQPHVGRYARQIGESVQSIAQNMEGRDLGEIAGMAERFGRKQPLAFLGAAALAGLAASRFLTASGKRAGSAARADTPAGSGEASLRNTGGYDVLGGSSNG
jgi:hypothetical protein